MFYLKASDTLKVETRSAYKSLYLETKHKILSIDRRTIGLYKFLKPYKFLVYKLLVFKLLVYKLLVYKRLVYKLLVYKLLVYKLLVYKLLVYQLLVYQLLVYRRCTHATNFISLRSFCFKAGEWYKSVGAT